jgi:hypothetical protein
MTVLTDAIARSRAAAERITAEPWRILPRVRRGEERPVPDASRQDFIVQAHLFAPDKADGRVAEVNAFETGRAPGILGDDLALVVWSAPAGSRIAQHDIAEEVVEAPAVGRRYRIAKPPGGDATGHVRLDLTALSPSAGAP